MSGCEGCFTSPKGQQEALLIIKQLAKRYAQENQETVAIYQEGYEFRYCTERIARQEQYRIIELISKYN